MPLRFLLFWVFIVVSTVFYKCIIVCNTLKCYRIWVKWTGVTGPNIALEYKYRLLHVSSVNITLLGLRVASLTHTAPASDVNLSLTLTMSEDADGPIFACHCLNIRIFQRIRAQNTSPPQTTAEGFSPVYIGDDGIIIVSLKSITSPSLLANRDSISRNIMN